MLEISRVNNCKLIQNSEMATSGCGIKWIVPVCFFSPIQN